MKSPKCSVDVLYTLSVSTLWGGGYQFIIPAFESNIRCNPCPIRPLTEVLEKIIVELLSSLALATKQVEEGGYTSSQISLGYVEAIL